MSGRSRWFIAAFVVLLMLGFALGVFLLGRFVVRLAVAGSPMAWPGPGMMGRPWGSADRVDWNYQNAPAGSCGDTTAAACSYGWTGGYGSNPASGCPLGGVSGSGANPPGSGQARTLQEPQAAVERCVAAYRNSDLTVPEVVEFGLNCYAIVEDKP